jgi:hypothetical protein
VRQGEDVSRCGFMPAPAVKLASRRSRPTRLGSSRQPAYLIARQRADDLPAALDLNDGDYEGYIEDITSQLGAP